MTVATLIRLANQPLTIPSPEPMIFTLPLVIDLGDRFVGRGEFHPMGHIGGVAIGVIAPGPAAAGLRPA